MLGGSCTKFWKDEASEEVALAVHVSEGGRDECAKGAPPGDRSMRKVEINKLKICINFLIIFTSE